MRRNVAFVILAAGAALLAGTGCPAHLAPPPEKLANWPEDRASLPALKLYLLRTGSVVSNWRYLVAGGESREVELPVPVTVIDHPTQGLVLVDTGFSRRTAIDPKDYPGPISTFFLPVRMKEGDEAIAQLARIGRRPDEVHTVILTHLHQDHTGGIEDFPDATYVVDRSEWEEGQRRSSLSGYVKRSYENIRSMRLVDFPAGRPKATFRSGVDVFGDGTIWLLPTPGHTRGHCSVLVFLRSHAVLLTGDAAYLEAYVTGAAKKSRWAKWFVDFDGDEFEDSLARIQRFRQLAPEALIIPSHDLDTWEKLKHLPEFYE